MYSELHNPTGNSNHCNSKCISEASPLLMMSISTNHSKSKNSFTVTFTRNTFIYIYISQINTECMRCVISLLQKELALSQALW